MNSVLFSIQYNRASTALMSEVLPVEMYSDDTAVSAHFD